MAQCCYESVYSLKDQKQASCSGVVVADPTGNVVVSSLSSPGGGQESYWHECCSGAHPGGGQGIEMACSSLTVKMLLLGVARLDKYRLSEAMLS